MKLQKRGSAGILCMIMAVLVAFAGIGLTPAKAAVANGSFPDRVNYGTLKWSLNLGTGYTNAPTPPMVHGDYVYVGMNQTLYKLDKETGHEIAKMTLVDSFGYATAALTYAENVDGRDVIFAPINNGVVQAVDAESMTSLWVTQIAWEGEKAPFLSCLSRVTYDNGYIYYGTWNTDRTTGYYYCHDTKDLDTESGIEAKPPVWMVSHSGGFYWSESNVDGDYVLFGSEDGDSGYTAGSNLADMYSCMKGEAFVAADKTIADSPVVDQFPVDGDVRSGVAYDSLTASYYFTTRPGKLYQSALTSEGKFTEATKSQTPLLLGGMTTGTPTAYQGKLYVGIQGATQFGADGHKVKAIDGQTMTVDAAIATPGFVQSEMVLSTAKESEGALYLYMTYNQLPGGLYMIKLTKTAEGKMEMDSAGSGNLFVPPSAMRHYGISTLDVDIDGNLYYKNDSCTLMAVKAGYLLESVPAIGGGITPTTSVLAGQSCTFTLTPAAGYKVADLLVDGVSQGIKSSTTFTAVAAPHKVQGVFLHVTTPNLISAVSTGYNSIRLSWNKMPGVTGYLIYRATSSTGTYTPIATLPATTTTYTNTGLSTGKAYYYKLRGYYKNTLGGFVYSNPSISPMGAIPKLSTPALTTTAGVDKIKLTWKAIPGASGYKIYRKTSATGSFYLMKTVVGGTATTWTNYYLTTGKTYYYRMIAYRVVSGKYYYSNYSTTSYKKPY